MKKLGGAVPARVAGGGARSPGACALVFGFFCVRLTRIYFAMLTLAFAQIVWAICFKWNEVTGGEQGMPDIPYPSFDWLERVAAVVPFLGGYRTSEYFYFLTLRARRRLPLAAPADHAARPSAGCWRRSARTPSAPSSSASTCGATSSLAFVLAGSFAGLAGGLFGIFNRGVFPDFAYWTKSSEVLIMTLLGGMGTFWGPAVGAARPARAEPADRVLHRVLAARPRHHPRAAALRVPGRHRGRASPTLVAAARAERAPCLRRASVTQDLRRLHRAQRGELRRAARIDQRHHRTRTAPARRRSSTCSPDTSRPTAGASCSRGAT